MKHILPALAALTMIAAPVAHAKREIQAWSIADFMNNPAYMSELNGVTFTWGDTIIGPSVATTNVERATEGMTKNDQEACEWALLSVLKLMRIHALEYGAKSVQGLKSTVAGEPYSSDSEYLCMSGFTNSRVFLTGSIVKEAPPAGTPVQVAPQASQRPPAAPVIMATPAIRSMPEVDPEQQRLYGDFTELPETEPAQ